MNVCIVGTGQRADLLARSLPSTSRLASVVSHDMQRSREFASHFNAVPYDRIEDVEPPDYFLIAVKIEDLYTTACKCIHFRKPIFLEKPGAESYKQLKSLYTEAADAHVKLYVAYPWSSANLPQNCGKIFERNKERIERICVTWVKQRTRHSNLCLNLLVHPLSWIHRHVDFVGKQINTSTNKVTLHGTSGDINIALHVEVDPCKCNQRTFEFYGQDVSIRISDDGTEVNLAKKQLELFEREITQAVTSNDIILSLKILKTLEDTCTKLM